MLQLSLKFADKYSIYNKEILFKSVPFMFTEHLKNETL